MRYIVTYLLVIVNFFLTYHQLSAQQTAQYTQWSLNQLFINPAHSGIKSCADLHSLYRMQWVGFDGAPKTGILTFTVPLKSKRKEFLSPRFGMGLRFENDHIGQFSSNRINISYAGHFNFSQDTRLSLGLYAGIIQLGYDPSKAITYEPDPAVHREANIVLPDASFGAWWNSKKYYVGLTIQNLMSSKWVDIGNNSKYRLHVLLNGGYKQRITEKISMLPAIMIKIPPQGKYALDIQAMIDFSNKVNFGIGYRNTDAILIFAGFKYKQQLSIQYSFDYTLSGLQNFSKNTHEVSFAFTTCKPENKDNIRCPLFE